MNLSFHWLDVCVSASINKKMSKKVCQSCGRSWIACHARTKTSCGCLFVLLSCRLVFSSISSNKMQLLCALYKRRRAEPNSTVCAYPVSVSHPTHARATFSPPMTEAAPPSVTAPAALLPLQFLSFLLPPTPSAPLASFPPPRIS